MSKILIRVVIYYFFFNDTATTEIYTLSLHDALPISRRRPGSCATATRSTSRSSPSWTCPASCRAPTRSSTASSAAARSEEHTSELQSRQYLVCRLLLEKKKYSNLKLAIHDHSLIPDL